MSNSKNNEETSFKSSFNKSKSISSAMDDLEMGRPISKAVPDLEIEDFTSELEDSISNNGLEEKTNSNTDLEVVSETNNESKSDKKHNYDDLSSFLDEDEEDVEVKFEDLDEEVKEDVEVKFEDLDEEVKEDVEVKFEDLDSVSKLNDKFGEQEITGNDDLISSEDDDLKENEDIFVSPKKVSDKIDLDKIENPEEPNISLDEDSSLARPTKKSKENNESNNSFSESISRPTKKSKKFKDSKKFFKKFNFSIKGLKSFYNDLSTKSKIFALVSLLLGVLIIIYGILNFNNVSDRVIDHALLGETGSWSIFLILIGLIIIIFDIFYVSYSVNSLNQSNIKNAQIRSTFDVIDKIKSIDDDYYQEESDNLGSIFDDILFSKESSKNTLNNSDFEEDEIYVDQSLRDLDGVDSVVSFEETEDLGSADVLDSYDVDSLNVENSIFDDETQDLSGSVEDDLAVADTEDLSGFVEDDLAIVSNNQDKSVKESNYDDLSSFLEEDEEDKVEDSNKSEFKKTVDIDSLINDSKIKSTQDEDFAAKKARIIEGTNFDNSLRKSKK